MIEVEDLTVRFGGVLSIDQMSVTFPSGTCGLIGPNGAGKTTFLNVLSGFVRPAAGRVAAFGDDLLVMSDYERARWGVRRTFQTEQAIEALTVYDNVLTVHEHTTKMRAPSVARRCSMRSRSSGSATWRSRRSVPCRRGNAGSSRWRGRSSARPEQCCSTSRAPGSRRPRPNTSARSSARSTIRWGRWSCSSSTT